MIARWIKNWFYTGDLQFSFNLFKSNGKLFDFKSGTKENNFVTRSGILLPKLFWPTVRKNCSSHQEKLLKFEAEGQEFANLLRSIELIQSMKGQSDFW